MLAKVMLAKVMLAKVMLSKIKTGNGGNDRWEGFVKGNAYPKKAPIQRSQRSVAIYPNPG
jgi:hypothetical protein